jgi:hypothetical protein
LIKWYLCAAAIVLVPVLSQVSRAQTPALNQKRFEEGVRLMHTDIDRAVTVFQQLYNETGAIRTQLELARSLYIAESLAKAKTEFIDILQKPIPITVRDKVEWYLSEIQKRQSAKVYMGVFRDTNPGQITSERTFQLFGQQLEYRPPTPTEAQTALNLTVQAERELKKRSGVYAQASLSTLTYRTSEYNKQVADLHVAKRWEDYNFKDVRIGNQTMFYGGQLLYNMPYVSSTLVFNRRNQDYYGVSAQFGVQEYPDYRYLSGTQLQGRAFYNHNITQNLTAFFEVGGDQVSAQERPYSSIGAYGAIGTQIAHSPTSLQLNLKATVSTRRYADTDPLWGQTRQDNGMILYASLVKRNFYVLGLTPVIEATYQTNNSNLSFYGYNKFFVGLFFKNVY